MTESSEDKLIRHLRRAPFETVNQGRWAYFADLDADKRHEAMVAVLQSFGWTNEEFIAECKSRGWVVFEDIEISFK